MLASIPFRPAKGHAEDSVEVQAAGSKQLGAAAGGCYFRRLAVASRAVQINHDHLTQCVGNVAPLDLLKVKTYKLRACLDVPRSQA